MVLKHDLPKDLKEPVRLAVVGGSGLYEIPGMETVGEFRVPTPFGPTSDVITVGLLGGVPCAFLPRHGKGHRLLPGEVPFRANVYALKSLGVQRIIAIGAVGSLREELVPRHFVIPDQVFDRTKNRPSTFFGDGVVAHVGVAQPFCPLLADVLYRGAQSLNIPVHRGGTYVCIEGPSFSTKAESRVNQSHGFSVVGMTVVPEYKLAREAEICYQTVSLVTDYDVWKDDDEVSAAKVVETIHANVDNVKKLISTVLPQCVGPRSCSCGSALSSAVFTKEDAIPRDTRLKLDLLLRKYLSPLL